MFRLLTRIPCLDACLGTLLLPRLPDALWPRPRLVSCSGGFGARHDPDLMFGMSHSTDYALATDDPHDAHEACAAGEMCGTREAWMAEPTQDNPTAAAPPITPPIVLGDSAHAFFRSEYAQEMESWLRRRFRVLCLCYLVLAAAVLALRLLIGFDEGPGRVLTIVATALGSAASLATVSWFYFGGAWMKATREQLIHSASMMILILGAISLARNGLIVGATGREENFLLPLFAWHFVACTLLPWTPRESLKPLLPLLGLWMLGVMLLEHTSIFERVLKIVFAPGVLVPGLCWSALRLKYHSERFRIQMVGKQFFTMRREMAEARTIHENLFPKMFDDGHVRFEYTYMPQRELGGDFVHLHTLHNGVVYVTLLDVTGHGLAAALTVNRLYGELERIFGETPEAEPADVLSLLNRYVHLTMVKHNIYVTGMCMRVDPVRGCIVWSSAGHPPALVRGANGVVRKLAATNILLGAVEPLEFNGQQSSMELSPGDTVVMYTDGVFESRDRDGIMLGLERLDALAHTQPPPRRWPQFIAAAVQRHSGGRNDDDILVATVTYLSPRPARVRQSETLTRIA